MAKKLRKEEECCLYRQMRLEKEKLEGEQKNRRKRVKKNVSACQDEENDVCDKPIEKPGQCKKPCCHVAKNSKRKKPIVAKDDCPAAEKPAAAQCKRIAKKAAAGAAGPCSTELLDRVSPSLEDRLKYADAQHSVCLMNEDELKRVKEIQELRKFMEKNEPCYGACPDDQASENKEGTCIKITEEEPRKSMNDPNKKSESQGKSCRTSAADEPTKHKSDRESICSLDSNVNVGDFSLTKEEIDSIEKKRKEIHAQN